MNIQKLFKLGMDRDIPELLPDNTSGIILNVGAGNKQIAGAIPLDLPEWDADCDQIPYADGTVSTIHCYHFLEHCAYPVDILQEFQRVLVVGGHVNIVVPYYNAQIQAQDLDHKHSFNEQTWKTLFRNPYYNKNRIEWRFKVHSNFIMAIVERNLALFTQIVKEA